MGHPQAQRDQSDGYHDPGDADAGPDAAEPRSVDRVMAGIEWREDYLKNLKLLSEKAAAFFEVGYVFERRLRFSTGREEFAPEPTWMIRFGSVW